MSYAIIRNAKYKRENLKGIFRHNERRNKNYSNKNINKEKSYLNYSLKDTQFTYKKEFDRIRKKYNLKGQIKTVSNIICEYIITSDKTFFDTIGEDETKRYFDECYKFICNYKNLGEKNIISAVVYLDEGAPHLHLMFVPVVHTKDKDGKEIEKICARDFWKGRDSYRKLQDAYFNHVKSKDFDLERGMFVEDTGRKHYSVEEYKKITNYENTKKILKEMKLDLPEVPNINDISKFSIKRDEKILEKIIKPQNDLIKELYKDNLALNKELSKQAKVVDEAVKYQKERDKIIADNKELHNTVKEIKYEYQSKNDTLDLKYDNRKRELEKEYQEKSYNLEYEYKYKVRKLEKENSKLHKIIDKFYETIDKFIHWICVKFDIAEEDNLIRDFQRETNTFLDPEKQIKHEEMEKEWDLER